MGEYSRNCHDGIAWNTGSAVCTKTNQAHWIRCFRIVDTVLTKVMQVQRLHMDLIWCFEAFSDSGNRRNLTEKQRKECERLEEEMRSLKQTMLEEVLCCETNDSNVITLPKASEENVVLLPDVGSTSLKYEGWVEVKQENNAEHSDNTEENADFSLDVQAEENSLKVIVPKLLPDSLNTVVSLDENPCNSTEMLETIYKTEVCAESNSSICSQEEPTVDGQLLPVSILPDAGYYDHNRQLSTTASSLMHHLRMYSDEKSFECEMCAKKFLRKSDFNRHLRMHKGEKPYECNVCGKRLTERSKLIRHLRIHSGEKPYACELCAKKFNEVTGLKNHLRMHKGEKPFQCGVCAKKFLKEHVLVRHLRTHNEEKPFGCEICARKFRDRSQLVTHRRIHNGEKPHECEICAKKFNHRKSLTYHLRMHNGEKPYDCGVCEKKFRGKSELIRHLTKAKSHLNVKSAQENITTGGT